MKREFLQNLKVGDEALSKEVIDAIMAENGRDIQRTKAAFSDYEQMKKELETAQSQQRDWDALQQAARDWEEKYRQAEKAHGSQLLQMQFDQNLSAAIGKERGRNAKAISALLDIERLRECENQPAAIEEALKNLKQECSYLFEEDQIPPPYARGTGSLGGRNDRCPATLAGALREKFERK